MGHQNFCFLKMIFLKKKVVRDVYISIMNRSAKFQSSNIIRKGVQICPILKKWCDRFAPPNFMERTSPIISVNHVHAGVSMKKKKHFFENHTKKKLFIICFRTQLSQKI